MEAISSVAVTLSDEERVLLIELLDREMKNLPVEIHHTRTLKFRDKLKHRMHVIEGLLVRLNADQRGEENNRWTE
jgi:hypothetical protein